MVLVCCVDPPSNIWPFTTMICKAAYACLYMAEMFFLCRYSLNLFLNYCLQLLRELCKVQNKFVRMLKWRYQKFTESINITLECCSAKPFVWYDRKSYFLELFVEQIVKPYSIQVGSYVDENQEDNTHHKIIITLLRYVLANKSAFLLTVAFLTCIN